MAKRKKQNSYGKKAFYIIIALIALFIIGFEAYRMVSSYIIKRASDKQWPQHDLTSGQYSGSYDGIDISRHQGRIHWDELGEVKRLKFVFVKEKLFDRFRKGVVDSAPRNVFEFADFT